MGDLLKKRLAEAREKHRIQNLLTNLRSGNVVTADTIRLAEALAAIAEGDMTADEMSKLALETLDETG